MNIKVEWQRFLDKTFPERDAYTNCFTKHSILKVNAHYFCGSHHFLSHYWDEILQKFVSKKVWKKMDAFGPRVDPGILQRFNTNLFRSYSAEPDMIEPLFVPLSTDLRERKYVEKLFLHPNNPFNLHLYKFFFSKYIPTNHFNPAGLNSKLVSIYFSRVFLENVDVSNDFFTNLFLIKYAIGNSLNLATRIVYPFRRMYVKVATNLVTKFTSIIIDDNITPEANVAIATRAFSFTGNRMKLRWHRNWLFFVRLAGYGSKKRLVRRTWDNFFSLIGDTPFQFALSFPEKRVFKKANFSCRFFKHNSLRLSNRKQLLGVQLNSKRDFEFNASEFYFPMSETYGDNLLKRYNYTMLISS